MQLTSNSDKITRDYFDSLLIETRYLDAVLPTTEMTLFGETFRTPIMTAALSHLHKPLLKNGADAVAGRINEMTAELAGIMARTGVSALDKMDSTIIHRRAF